MQASCIGDDQRLHSPSRFAASAASACNRSNSPTRWRRARSGRALIRNPLMELLHAVREHGSISAAARGARPVLPPCVGRAQALGSELGHPLVVWDKGQPARLSEFGDKLLWAERQAQARLAPQIEALHAELERAFAVAFDDSAHVLSAVSPATTTRCRCCASTRPRSAQLHLDIHFTGSVDAISALNEGRCVIAGFHALERRARGLAGAAHLPAAAQARPAQAHRLRAAQPGPDRRARQPAAALRSLADLARRGRASSTGARAPARACCSTSCWHATGSTPSAIAGYARRAVARRRRAGGRHRRRPTPGSASKRRRARAASDFVPLVQERYHLVCLKSALDQPADRRPCSSCCAARPGRISWARCRATSARAAARCIA